ncbi:MAG: phosphotransferase [Anaerolineae bacterium]|nr:phosphotransferase [Anaerolineae bacterium]
MMQPTGRRESILVTVLAEHYGLHVDDLEFLPLGADLDSSVYAASSVGKRYFVKLRSRRFTPITVLLPAWMAEHGITQVIVPLKTKGGAAWVEADGLRVIVYPFLEGRDGFKRPLEAADWQALGQVLRLIHELALPETLRQVMRQETFGLEWCAVLRNIMADNDDLSTDGAMLLKPLLHSRQETIHRLIHHAEVLAQRIEPQGLAFVPCHSDIHPGNVFFPFSGGLRVVDWDEPILAPRERDLMYIGSGIGPAIHPAEKEEEWFFAGYGRIPLHSEVLCYYRYYRIVEDIALYCQQILSDTANMEEKNLAVHYLASNFNPRGTIENADRAVRQAGIRL